MLGLRSVEYGMSRHSIHVRSNDEQCGWNSQYLAEFDPTTRTIWGWLRPPGVPCFNRRLLKEIRTFDATLEHHGGSVAIGDQMHEVHYYVVSSLSAGAFSLGGDLFLFLSLIEWRDRRGLTEYMKLCIDNVHARVRNYGSSTLATITLLRGAALGGGLECALSSDVIIAEESTRLGLPEILFNLFPGMGAYSLLARRVGMSKAEELMLSGKLYSARDFCALGLVDVVTRDGEGEAAVVDWISKSERRHEGRRALLSARHRVDPISRAELDAIGETWVEAALRLESRDLKVMRRIARQQQVTGGIH
jgi:DSF synthase